MKLRRGHDGKSRRQLRGRLLSGDNEDLYCNESTCCRKEHCESTYDRDGL